MMELRIEGDKIDDLVHFLSDGNSSDEDICKASIVREISGKKVGFFVFEGYYFRTQGTVTGSVFICQTDLNSCEIIIVGSGGASLLGVTWGAQRDIERKISSAILHFATKAGMSARQVQSLKG